MYSIYTRSKREPFYIHDDTLGAKLQQQWLNGTLPKRLQIGDWVGETDQIKAIEKSGKDADDDAWLDNALNNKKQGFNEYINKVNEEYTQYHIQRYKRGIVANASDFALVNIMWRSVVGTKEMPKDAAEAIVERQRAYLEEHPGYTYANPMCYKDILDKHSALRDNKEAVFVKAYMGMVERILGADIREARILALHK
jgi:hypothetical protein